MTFDASFVTDLDDTVERVVLLSEQTQQIILMAIDSLNYRSAWDEMSDSEWDDLYGRIGDALTQTLLEQSGGASVNVETKDVSLSSGFVISGSQTSYPVDWDTGDYDATDNSKVYVENDGRFILTLNVDFDSASSNRGEPEIWVNGSLYAKLIQSSAANRSYSLSTTIELSSGDYVQLKVSTNGTVTVAVSDYTTRMSLTGFYQ